MILVRMWHPALTSAKVFFYWGGDRLVKFPIEHTIYLKVWAVSSKNTNVVIFVFVIFAIHKRNTTIVYRYTVAPDVCICAVCQSVRLFLHNIINLDILFWRNWLTGFTKILHEGFEIILHV